MEKKKNSSKMRQSPLLWPGVATGPMAVGCSNKVDPSSSEYISLFAESLLSYPDWDPLRRRSAMGPGGLGLDPGSVSVKA